MRRAFVVVLDACGVGALPDAAEDGDAGANTLEHLAPGRPIAYTSQDSVLQIATHVDVMAPERLYELCGRLRNRLGPEHAVGRVIARPFAGTDGAFRRTDGRRDFSVRPPTRSYLEELHAAEVPAPTVG